MQQWCAASLAILSVQSVDGLHRSQNLRSDKFFRRDTFLQRVDQQRVEALHKIESRHRASRQDPEDGDDEDPKELVYYVEEAECVEMDGREMYRGLPPDPKTDLIFGKPNLTIAPDDCFEYCRKAETLYMGLKDEDCYCFDQFKGVEQPDGRCTTPCVGDPDLPCGGPGTLYSVHLMLAWVPKPRPKKCGAPPEIPGAAETCTKGSNLASERACNVTCAEGFKLTDNSLLCDTVMGQWFGHATCREIKCGPPIDVPWSKSTCMSASAHGNGTCKVECSDEAKLKRNSLKCTSLGEDHPDLVGFYTGEAVCLPRNCGVAPKFRNALSSDHEIIVGMLAHYTCEHGYTLDAQATGVNSFFSRCKEDEKFDAPAAGTACKPVECGPVPEVENTENNGVHTLTFPERATFECEHGFSVDGFGQIRTSELACEANGAFTTWAHCQPSKCGLAPSFANSDMVTSEFRGEMMVNGQIVKYKCNKGYEIEGGGQDFITKCNGGEGFTVAPVCKAVSCGKLPSIENAQVGLTEIFFPTVVTYTCNRGYTTSGEVTGPRTFERSCQSDKALSPPGECLPVKCGAPRQPTDGKVANGVPDNDIVLFPMVVQYECDAGFSLDRTHNSGAKVGTYQCLESGDYSEIKPCLDINDCEGHSCGPHGECVDHFMNYTCSCLSGYAMVWHTESNEPPTHENAELVCGNVNDCGPSQCGEGGTCEDLINDYTCNCLDGFEMIETEDEKLCMHKVCGMPPDADNTVEQEPVKQKFTDVLEYVCLPGFTLNGEAAGAKTFDVPCRASGNFGPVQSCRNLTCGTPPSVELADVDEEDVLFPHKAKYRCKRGNSVGGAPQGARSFEVGCTENGKYDKRLECNRVVCGAPPLIDLAHVDMTPLKFEELAKYTCTEGHATDPKDPSKREFEAPCEDDGTYKIDFSCLPVTCPLPAMKQGLMVEYFHPFDSDEVAKDAIGAAMERIEDEFDVARAQMPFIERVAIRWTGQILIGAAGMYQFKVESDGDAILFLDGSNGGGPGGNFLETAHGVRRIVGHRGERSGRVLYVQALRSLGLDSGKLSANASAAKSKTWSRELAVGSHEVYMELIRKQDKGTGFKWSYTGPDTGDKWQPVPGDRVTPPEVPFDGPPTVAGTGHSMNITEVHFNQVATYACKHGFSVDGHPNSVGELAPKCNKDGLLDGYAPCLPVVCSKSGLPEAPDAKVVEHEGDITYGEFIRFKCDAGFAVERTLTDKALLIDMGDLKKSWGVECQATGSFSSANSCKNIDDCHGHSCGPHGTCVDGIEDYSCDCQEGFEETVKGGEKSCGNIDDCAPGACGEHGLCHDLVSTYRCECFTGFEPKDEGGETVCKPKVCPELAILDKTSMLAVQTLIFGDSVRVECAEGHSIDGSPDEKLFHIECGADGLLSVHPDGCMAVKCGFAPSVFNVASGPAEDKAFHFGEVAHYECAEGHTVDGTASATTEIEIPCGADGLFPNVLDCKPVSCGVAPTMGKAAVAEREISFPGKALYTCDQGYTLTNERPAEVTFERKCLATGKFEDVPSGLLEGSDFECSHVSCGVPPAVANTKEGERSNPRIYAEHVAYDCKEGFTVDGTPRGVSDFTVLCQADGTFTAPATTACQEVTYPVRGKIADATNMNAKSNVKVILKQGEAEYEAFTDRMGVYELTGVRLGDSNMTTELSGYISGSKHLNVMGAICPGTTADMAISPTLPADGWRAVLTWEKQPYDLDSHVYFAGSSCKMYWAKRNVQCSAYGNVRAILDVDDTKSFGPETTTFLDLNKCKAKRPGETCKLVFKVHNYSRKPGWAESKAVVKVYNGDREVATFKVGENGQTEGSAGSSKQYWSVFHLDGNAGTVTECTTPQCT